MLTMIGAINQFERENLKERQMEGIAIAKRNGKYKGRKKLEIANFDEYYNRYMKREINKVQLAKELNIHRSTIDRIIKEHENHKYVICKGLKWEDMSFGDIITPNLNEHRIMVAYAYMYAFQSFYRHLIKSKHLGNALVKTEDFVRNYYTYFYYSEQGYKYINDLI